MHAMRPRATASAVFTGILLTALAFSACSGGPTPSSHPEQPPDSALTSSPAPAAPASGVDMPEPPSAGPASSAKTAKKAPATVADCKELLSEITNDPPESGVVLNNAALVDAGTSQRLDPLVDTIKSHRNSFRCCFDIYSRKNLGARGKVTWQLKLNPDGAVQEATIVHDKSDITAPEVESCMAELAKSITWARSPNGKDTVLNYPFDFKPRN
jgi:hypothetical protein